MPESSIPSAEAFTDPFSMEQAYKTYQDNIRKAGQLVFDLTKGARSGLPEHDLLLMAVEIIGRMTDNTALLPVISEALAARSVSPVSSPGDGKEGSEP